MTARITVAAISEPCRVLVMDMDRDGVTVNAVRGERIAAGEEQTFYVSAPERRIQVVNGEQS